MVLRHNSQSTEKKGGSETPLLTDGNRMRVSAGNQRQVYSGYVNDQGHGDTEDAYPKPPIAVRPSPVGTHKPPHNAGVITFEALRFARRIKRQSD